MIITTTMTITIITTAMTTTTITADPFSRLKASVASAVFFAIGMGLIYLRMSHNQASIQDRLGVLFFVCIDTCFSSVTSQINTCK